MFTEGFYAELQYISLNNVRAIASLHHDSQIYSIKQKIITLFNKPRIL